MPSIDDIQPKKPFKKKSYRPWDLGLDDLPLKSELSDRDTLEASSYGHKNNTNITHKVPNLSEGSVETLKKTDTKVTRNMQSLAVESNLKSIVLIVGVQRKLLLHIYESCKRTRAHYSEPLTLEHIVSVLGIRIGSIKTSLARLQEKKIISRNFFKKGRGGWVTYELDEFVYRELLQLEMQHKIDTNTTRGQSNDLVEEKKTVKANENDSVQHKALLPIDWEEINLDLLHEIGFTKAHLIQIYNKGQLTSQMVQDSINAFSFDFQKIEFKEKVPDPIRFLMGILVKNGVPYSPSEGYVDPKVEALRQYTEKKRKEKETREKLEQEAYEFAFGEWYDLLTDNNKLELLSEEQKKALSSSGSGPIKEMMIKSELQGYYKSHVWPEFYSGF